jgi:FkbM family methyltransferase
MNIETSCTNYGDMKYLKNDYYIAQSLSKNEMYEQSYVEKDLIEYIKNAKVILDIGAHIGCHSVMYSVINPNAIIHSFEMQKELYDLLKINSKSITYNCAVGNKIKMINQSNFITDGPNYNTQIEYNTKKEFNYGGLSVGFNGEESLMITIDSLNLNECDFIKIDVEGFEYAVILGAINTIMRFKPVIFYEVNPNKPFSDEHFIISEINTKSDTCVEYLLRSLGYNEFYEIGMNVLALSK